MAKNKEYTDKDIKVLTDQEHVRLRLPVYAGNINPIEYNVPLFLDGKFSIAPLTFSPAVFKQLQEIIDNSQDEFSQITKDNKILTIKADAANGTYQVTDNGRGVPVTKHETGKYTPEVVFTQLRSGRNFSSDKEVGTIGQNGIGSSMTCFVSEKFEIDIVRDGIEYHQTIKDGGLKIGKPSLKPTTSNKTGTCISFTLDKSLFTDVSLPEKLVHNRAIEVALTNPGVTVRYNGTEYKYKKGFDDIIKQISSNYFKFERDGIEIYVIFDLCHDGSIDEQIFSWVNSSLLFDGGMCNTQFFNAFVDKTINHLSKEARKNKCEVTKNDIRRNLVILGNLKISDPQYDSQAKTRLIGPNLRKEMVDMIDENWLSFSRRNKDWLQSVLEQAMIRHHNDANTKAIKEHQKSSRKKIAGLIDAASSNIFERQLLITEGDSAALFITQSRDPETTGSLPLRGKINNVYGSTVAQLLQMGKVADLLSAIGLVPGQKAIRSDLRYGKIVIATDADVDGGDIFTLLINLFYQYWPELFDKNYDPIVYRLLAPNVCLTKGKERIHIPSRDEYEAIKHKYKGYNVAYYKGLGSMSKEDWDMILSGKTDTRIPIVDRDGTMKDTLKLLFSDNADDRKKWLQKD